MKSQLNINSSNQRSFNVNQDFAKKYEYRENRKLIERNKGIEQDVESSDASDEDSNGDMINEEFYGKFIT
jgi:hypothetical protein